MILSAQLSPSLIDTNALSIAIHAPFSKVSLLGKEWMPVVVYLVLAITLLSLTFAL